MTKQTNKGWIGAVMASALFLAIAAMGSCGSDDPASPDPGGQDTIVQGDTTMIIDHACCDISLIPRQAIQDAIDALVIAYGHTSHGNQLIQGMNYLADFLGDDLYNHSLDGAGNTLELRDKAMPGDLGNPNWTQWEVETRSYLAGHPEVNVIIWSWCGEVSYATEENIDTYLSLMNGLENDYPEVSFVYMTGHLDGQPPGYTIHLRNQQIRDYCVANDKILYDFADIESYDPDGSYYADKRADDACNYDSDGDAYRESNWALDWQAAHPGEWYECDPDHTQHLNGNLKAYAAWWLWARLGGWDGTPE
ncbi:MAG: hypothetical protein MUF59_08435 [Candidatus Krumholzibacteria bacterium]|nr:hypothetical protein [Candidatus Krumholzibacteria bacterium]